jgi:hypothetical protein
LAKFRQNFAVAAVPLVDSVRQGDVSCESIVRFKGDLWGVLEDIKDGKKPKTLPGHLKFSVTATPSVQFYVNRLSSSLNPREYFNEKDPEVRSRVIAPELRRYVLIEVLCCFCA